MSENKYIQHPIYDNVLVSTKEEWRDVPGWEGMYQVSNQGRVKSLERLKRSTNNGVQIVPERILKYGYGTINRGYLFVALCRNGKVSRRGVHYLVLLAFIGERPKGMICRHYPDKSPANNRLENLCWGTAKQNTADMWEHGSMPFGEHHGKSKLTVQQIREIRKSKLGKSVLAKLYDIAPDYANTIRRGEVWKHLL